MKFLIFLSAAVTALSASLPSGAQTRKYQVTPGLTAIITHTQGTAVVEVAMPGVELISLDLTQPPATVFQIKTVDYNFDGFKDFAFVGVNQATGILVYDIFLYHPADKSFEALDVPGGACEVFGNVRLGTADKTLRSSCKSGSKSSLDIYKWATPFSLELVKSTDNGKDAQADQAEERADRKAEKGDQLQDKREQRKERQHKEEDDE